jgi:hypothetical protein
MGIWLIVILSLLLAAAGLLFAKITTTIAISGQGLNWTMVYTSRFLGWRSTHAWKVPMTPAQQAKSTIGFDLRKVHKGISAIRVFFRLIHHLWRRTTVSGFRCAVYLGVDEAGGTALLVGSLKNLLGPWVSLRIAPHSAEPPQYGIYPLWDKAGGECEFHTTLTFRPIDISSAAIAAVAAAVRPKAGRVQQGGR